MSTTKVEKKLVYIEYRTEENPEGASLMEHPGDVQLELTRDTVLIKNSLAVENEPAQGIVCAYLGVDGHWHFDHYLTREEIKKNRV